MSTPVSSYILIKLASRCNLACSYCYWFRDKGVYNTAAIIKPAVLDALVSRLGDHIRKHCLSEFNCIFHGGEPLLFGAERLIELIGKLKRLEDETACRILFSITTNGVLINERWANLFATHRVHVAVSLDGPKELHDKWRPKHDGTGSHEEAVKGFRLLDQFGVRPSIIAVCDPNSDPIATLRFFADDLKCQQFDVLPPDLNHNDRPIAPIAPYYIPFFDAWYDDYFDRGVRVRFLLSLVRSVLGLQTKSDSIGYGPLHTVTVGTDGDLEPNDVLRIAGSERTRTNANVMTHSLEDVRTEPAWREAYSNSLRLCAQCEACCYRDACGGGHLSHRWSDDRRYDNPSVYCDDLKAMFEHVWHRVSNDIKVGCGPSQVSLSTFTNRILFANSASEGKSETDRLIAEPVALSKAPTRTSRRLRVL